MRKYVGVIDVEVNENDLVTCGYEFITHSGSHYIYQHLGWPTGGRLWKYKDGKHSLVLDEIDEAYIPLRYGGRTYFEGVDGNMSTSTIVAYTSTEWEISINDDLTHTAVWRKAGTGEALLVRSDESVLALV
jgi:hypothetical protein